MSPAEPPTRLTTSPRVFFTERRQPGISFTERMTGYWSRSAGGKAPRDPSLRDYERAFEDGRRSGRSLELVLTVVAESLDVMLGDPNHRADFAGTATISGVAGAAAAVPLLVTHGVFRLFVENWKEIDSKRMTYTATLTAADGREWKLAGFKAVRHGGGIAHFFGDGDARAASPWRDQTRLFFELTSPAGHALGILTLSAQDFVRELLGIRAPGAMRAVERCDTVARFLVFFGGVLRDTYGGPFARSRYAPPNWWRRTRRPLRGKDGGELRPDPHRFSTSDGVELQLTRYRNPDKRDVTRGPVILAPGFGVRADSFAIDTVHQNIVEFLCEKGYDVWLFDYRASPELDASREPFSIDDIARIDWLKAVDEVRRLTAKGKEEPKVDVIAHCVGAMSFMMSALAGDLRGKIGSAVCSQVGAHPVGSKLNQLKAVAGLGYWLQLLFGVKALRVTVQAADTYRRPALDRLLKFYPTDDWCDNPVCSRIRFVFGESYLHANLNRGTHDAVIEMFGNPGRDRSNQVIVERFGDPLAARVADATRRTLRRLGFADPARGRAAYASLRALGQLARILSEGRLLTEDGEAYLTDDNDNLRNLDFRLCLMSGRKNHIFPPEGIDETRRRFEDARDRGKAPELRELGWLPFEDYAHMDCFIGARAATDVFPDVYDWLAGAPPPRGSSGEPASA